VPALPAALRPRKNAKHAKPSAARPALAAGGLTAAFLLADGAVVANTALAATADDFAALRQCESGGNYAINTGNGYSGAYQFDAGTWRSLGYSGLAYQASPATQDAAAAQLQAARGWSPWPACSRSLGLGSGSPARASRSAPVAAPTHTHAPPTHTHAPPTHTHAPPTHTHAVAASASAPAFAGTALNGAPQREDVRAWQAQMQRRGWRIAVDGWYGPQSASVATRFAAEKGLSTPAGSLDSVAYQAAWTAPIT